MLCLGRFYAARNRQEGEVNERPSSCAALKDSTREHDRIDAVLDRDETGGRKFGDPMGERLDEIAELLPGQGAIDPVIALSKLRIVVLRST
jgi:hypothetical protein